MKCWYPPAFNAQGSRPIIVVVQIGAVKIYVAAVEALKKKERQDETHSVYHQNWWFSGLKNAKWTFRQVEEALKKNERQDETGFTTKTDGFLSFVPPW